MAIKATAGAGLLSVIGDQRNNTITTSRNAAGQILINGGAVSIDGGNATVANTTEIDLFGQGGDDTIALDETNGSLPSAHLFGGNGNDVLTGGSSADLLFGQNGDDTLLGKGGDDQLFGGNGNDALTGGAGSDQVFGQNGNDRMIWNPGDGSDLFEGGNGTDTAEVNGAGVAETFTIATNGERVQFDRVSPAPFSIDIGTTENLVLNANDGDDVIDASALMAGQINLTINGGAGNDTVTGSNGNDLVIGGTGKDLASMGAGDDTFVWNQGDGSDIVEGQSGADTLRFNGFNADEKFDISANGSRARLSRDLGNIVMDVNGTETIDLHAQGGADTITVNDLAGTDVSNVNLDLGGADGRVDTVVINTTDAISFTSNDGVVTVSGLAAEVTISNFEADDRLVINGVGVPLGSVAQSAALLSQFMASSFATAGDGHGATPVADQPPTQQPLLAQPHA
jgi:Ca2+-binding RTX toxin-like protein